MSKWIAIIVGISALLWFLLSGPDAVPVQTVEAQKRELTVTVQEQGRTRARLPYLITAPVSGHLLRSSWIEGDRVTQGQLIAELALVSEDTRTEASYRANLAAASARRSAAEAALSEAQSALSRAEREAQRRDRLFLDRMIGEEERDAFQQAFEAAEARLLSVRSALNAALADENSARALLLGVGNSDAPNSALGIYAPVTGTIQVVHERGDRVIPAGTAIVQISNDDALELVIDLLTQDAVRVSPGNPIIVSGWGGGHDLKAVVDYIEPQAFTKYSALGVEEQRVNVIATLLDSDHALGSGYRIAAAIVVWQQSGTLTVPTSAIFRRNLSWHVYAVENDRAVLKPIEIGQRSRDHAQILSGLTEGAKVIVFPSDQITDGVAVITQP
jgi:HlyD family secretion protein